MSQLRELCTTLTAVDHDIVTMARELHQRAQACNRAAGYAAASARNVDGTNNYAAVEAAAALNTAARSVTRAAALLNQAAQQGEAFVARTTNGGGNGSGQIGGSGGAGHDLPAPPVASIADIRAWLGGVNTPYNADPYDPRSAENCGSCAAAVFARLNGDPSAVASLGTYSIEEMEATTGRTQTKMSPNQIHDYLSKMEQARTRSWESTAQAHRATGSTPTTMGPESLRWMGKQARSWTGHPTTGR